LIEVFEFQVIFRGVVQGVGFRACVYQIVKKYESKGFVRNLKNGSVELVILCNSLTLEKLIEDIKAKAKAAAIDSIEIEKRAFASNFNNFVILRDA
jgi:acylphosphatase